MTISSGWTTAEIREFVHQYQVQPHRQKRQWLAAQGVAYDRLRRWRAAVYAGDLDRGLVPREASGMTMSPAARTALERERAAERAAHAAELARLRQRVAELEASNGILGQANDALGKAIGLLQARSEHEPDAPPATSDPSGS